MSNPLILEPQNTTDACVIWLHGPGADRYDLVPVAKDLQGLRRSTVFAMPEAPMRPVTVNGGAAIASWYDIKAMTQARATGEAQVEESGEHVVGLVEAERAKAIDRARIFLA